LRPEGIGALFAARSAIAKSVTKAIIRLKQLLGFSSFEIKITTFYLTIIS